MFVRWKARRLAGDARSLDGAIVENRREGGKVRQRVICYLGTVNETSAAELRERVLFWERAAGRLDGLSLNRKSRKAIEAKISATIEYVGPRERERYREAGWKRIEEIYARP